MKLWANADLTLLFGRSEIKEENEHMEAWRRTYFFSVDTIQQERRQQETIKSKFIL